jgi:hypothetical protein
MTVKRKALIAAFAIVIVVPPALLIWPNQNTAQLTYQGRWFLRTGNSDRNFWPGADEVDLADMLHSTYSGDRSDRPSCNYAIGYVLQLQDEAPTKLTRLIRSVTRKERQSYVLVPIVEATLTWTDEKGFTLQQKGTDQEILRFSSSHDAKAVEKELAEYLWQRVSQMQADLRNSPEAKVDGPFPPAHQ